MDELKERLDFLKKMALAAGTLPMVLGGAITRNL